MDNTIGFYPMNVGSIPARRTKCQEEVSGCDGIGIRVGLRSQIL